MLGAMRILKKITPKYRTPTPVNTTPYTVLLADTDINVDATSNPITVVLPPATGSGRLIDIKKVDISSNFVTVLADTTGTPDTIDGDASFDLVYPWASITLQDGASNVWYIK